MIGYAYARGWRGIEGDDDAATAEDHPHQTDVTTTLSYVTEGATTNG